MVEESIPTWESYCRHIDAASLAADQERTKQYMSLVQQYAASATVDQSTAATPAQSTPTSTRWRTIALKTIRAVVGSDAMAVETTEQLNVVTPVILENLDLERGGSLAPLQERASTGEKQSFEMARRRRMSTATVPSVDEISTDPANAAETTADADKLAEEEVKVLAIRCLKQIFSVSTGTSRTQMRMATAMVLRYIAMKERPSTARRPEPNASFTPDWATRLFETIARWTPVQDRFIIVIVTVETLVRSPIVESILEKQLVLATLVDWLLRSDINLIGLSVMDVLLRLVQHTLLLLQLGSRDSTAVVQNQQADTLGLYKEMTASFDPAQLITEPERGRLRDAKESTPSLVRIELLNVLQRCISDLATHIYYTDQISDMLTAIMARLKPSSASDVPTAAAAVNDPVRATKALVASAHLQEDPSTDGFFSFATARVVALKAVKEILLTAHSQRTSAGASAEVRSRVGAQVWDGTQWLLKDDDPEVRTAYVDAVVTWLRLETNKADLHLPQDGPRMPRTTKRERHANGEVSIAKRAASNASKKGERRTKSSFLQLLHLAIYDDAVERAEHEPSILLLLLLLWTLVERLGVNAIRTGLPMIMNLQSAVLNGNDHSPAARARVAGLVHGYLWAIADKFNFETSPLGMELNSEISRRKRFSCWCDRIKFPPLAVPEIVATSIASQNQTQTSAEAADTIRPFLNITAFVEEVATAYDMSLVSPPTSPPSSPGGRVFSVPTLGFGYGYNAAPVHKPSPENQMPQRIKDEMCGTWSREACLASIDKESNPSLAGSRTAASSMGAGRQHLSVQQKLNGGVSGQHTPADTDPVQMPPISAGLGSLSRARKFSAASSLRDPDTSSRDSTMRVSDLKRALAGANGGFRGQSPLRTANGGRTIGTSRRSARSHSSDSESMVSWNPADNDDHSFIEGEKGQKSRPGTAISQPQSQPQPQAHVAHTFHDQVTVTSNPEFDSDVPPVPKIPDALNLPMAGTWPRDSSPDKHSPSNLTHEQIAPSAPSYTTLPTRDESASLNTLPRTGGEKAKRRVISRPASRAGGASVWSHSTSGRKTDLSSLLDSIKVGDVGEEEKSRRNVSNGSNRMLRPPY